MAGKKVDDLYKWPTFPPSGLHQRQILHVESGADEGHWAETSSIYTNHQHLRGFYTKENYRGDTHLYNIIN